MTAAKRPTTGKNELHESFRNYNKPKKRDKPKTPKRKLPSKTAKGFKNDLL